MALAPRGLLDCIMLENVEEFQEWGPLGPDERPCPVRKGQTFDRWVAAMRRLGGRVDWKELVAADYGEATTRKRLFVVVRFDGRPIVWPEPTHARDPGASLYTMHLPKWRAAAECIDWSLPCPSIFERARPLAENTMARVAAGVKRFVVDAAEPFIVGIDNKSSGAGAVWGIGEPLRTITAENRFALVAPSLVQVGYGERVGQAPRALDISKPLGTVVGTGKHALVAAFLAKHYTGVVGQGLEVPLGTITSVDHHSLVCAFLTKYYGTGTGQGLVEPMATITSKDRMGLVTVGLERFRIVDIGLRMLQPHELAAAQGFPASYKLVGTKSAQVARIGNSVCPRVVAALVRANLGVGVAVAA
jgi:DNA (cytosine-5)-methyltransferase 1